LTRIRGLTVKPRKDAAGRPRRDPAKRSAESLEELLELPNDGQSSSDQSEPTLDILRNEKSIVKYCRDSGLKPTSISVVLAVFRSLGRSKESYANVWDGCKHFYKTNGTTASRLLDAHDVIVSEADVNGARYRINALLFAFNFRARCEELRLDDSDATRSKKTKETKETIETAILRKVMEESNKKSDQIYTSLKRGRFYAQWVNELGIGAILALGESLA
jgi:hypothetical protein